MSRCLALLGAFSHAWCKCYEEYGFRIEPQSAMGESWYSEAWQTNEMPLRVLLEDFHLQRRREGLLSEASQGSRDDGHRGGGRSIMERYPSSTKKVSFDLKTCHEDAAATKLYGVRISQLRIWGEGA